MTRFEEAKQRAQELNKLHPDIRHFVGINYNIVRARRVKMEYQVEYTISNYGGTITLGSIHPQSDYVEEMFYNGTLFQTINLDNDGLCRLNIHVDDDGYLSIHELEKYVGWVTIDKN